MTVWSSAWRSSTSSGRATPNAEEGTAGTDSNGVSLSEYVYSDADLDDFQNITRTVNYELNELHTQIDKQQGAIEELSVAVLLNSQPQ